MISCVGLIDLAEMPTQTLHSLLNSETDIVSVYFLYKLKIYVKVFL